MANPKPIPKAAKRGEELVQRTRACILNALDAVENRGKVISEVLADEFENNPIKFMELASKFMPKEVSGNVSHEHKHEHVAISEINSWLAGITGQPEDSDSKTPNTH